MSVDLVKKFGSTYKAGQTIFKEGDFAEEMYIIHQGQVHISKRAKNAEQILATLRDGDFFGEMALFTESPRSATAVVVTDSVILKIDKKSFDFMVNNNSTFAINMIRKLCERLRNADNQIGELLVVSRETRILKAMSAFWNSEGQKDASGQVLLLPYLGFCDYLKKTYGITVEDANQSLLKLRNQNLLHIRKDTVGKQYIAFSPKVLEFFHLT
ncbi:MAG: CRP-like cAMP-activated global transcriptional regulator [Turneriella sp.]|nr:CRP-like cAMP-activated global transcriptional regulator [Turneriella sp.]